MKSRTLVLILVIVVVAVAALFAVMLTRDKQVASINNFAECQAAGYPIMESYPEQCRTPDGRNFVRVIEVIYVAFDKPHTLQVGEKIDFADGLSVALVYINDSRCKPGRMCIWAGELAPLLEVTGGGVGQSREEIQLGYTTATQVIKYGYVFSLNNAAKDTATITVTNAVKITTPNNPGPCYLGGCGNELCSDEEGVVSVCMYRKEYACYKTAQCARQSNGQCGWTETVALRACLNGR
ncbi:MAG: hypothetical protein Q7S66_01335 [bacterium]|nr:hypothetical protein [bacterium]